MPVFIDQTGQTVDIPESPQRIISLVPSQTELLFDLGLNEEVIGITKFCVHPDQWFRAKTRVGGTKQLKPEIIQQLQPDLIIANKEENVKQQVEALAKDFPVWTSDIKNLDEAYQMMEQVGIITGREQPAKDLVGQIKENFSEFNTKERRSTATYLIWQKPYMTVGHDTFIHYMLKAAGFENAFKEETRYPEITIEQIKQRKSEFLLLSSEPFPFKQKHAEELQSFLPGTKILLVDGEMFSWYGSRLLHAPSYFMDLQRKCRNLEI